MKNNKKLDLISLNEDLLDLNINNKKNKIVNDLKKLISIMKQPDLKSLLNDNDFNLKSKKPLLIPSNTSIYESSQLLLSNNVTSALIVHNNTGNKEDNNDHSINETILNANDILGILTTKDLVYRVLACQIDLNSSSVVRIMTPKPEIAIESMSINHALRLMYEGKYLNLPIKDSNNNIIALINVLDLTYALIKILNQSSLHSDNKNNLETADSIKSNNKNSNSNHHNNNVPAWNKFWDSLDRPLNNPLSNSHLYSVNNSSNGSINFSKRSFSVADKPSNKIKLTTSLNSKRSFSYTNLPESTNFNDLNNSYVNLQNGDDSDSDFYSFGKNVKSYYFNDPIENSKPELESNLNINNTNLENRRLITIKLKINELIGVNLGFNDKIYLTELEYDENVMYDSIMSFISKKIPITEDIIVHLGYLDNDNDFITIESIEDINIAMKQSNDNNLSMIVKLKKVNSVNSNLSLSFIKNLCFKSFGMAKNFYKRNDFFWGGIGLFMFVVTKYIIIDKRM